jgi:hypothetical protein
MMPVKNLPAPADGQRVETGAVQFGDDWPGLFIRGDNAHSLAMNLSQLEVSLQEKDHAKADAFMSQVKWLVAVIQGEVIVKPQESF